MLRPLNLSSQKLSDHQLLALTDIGLSKEHKDLETLHELKGPMTRSKAKFLQEEMTKRIKNELLIKDKEGENHKELNWSMLKIVEQPAKSRQLAKRNSSNWAWRKCLS